MSGDDGTYQSMQALVNSVQSTTDYAVLGSRLRHGGMSEGEIGNLLGLVERTIRDNVVVASQRAATDSVMAILTVFVELMSRAHTAAAAEIIRGLKARQVGFGSSRAHAGCVQIAQAVLDQGPRKLEVNPVVFVQNQ